MHVRSMAALLVALIAAHPATAAFTFNLTSSDQSGDGIVTPGEIVTITVTAHDMGQGSSQIDVNNNSSLSVLGDGVESMRVTISATGSDALSVDGALGSEIVLDDFEQGPLLLSQNIGGTYSAGNRFIITSRAPTLIAPTPLPMLEFSYAAGAAGTQAIIGITNPTDVAFNYLGTPTGDFAPSASQSVTVSVVAVPEPSSFALLALSPLGLGLRRRRRAVA